MEIKATTKPKKIRKLLAILVAMGFMSFASVNVASADDYTITDTTSLNTFLGQGAYFSGKVQNEFELDNNIIERSIAGETTIDGGNFTIDGKSTYSGFLFSNSSATNTTIQNLTIKNTKATSLSNGAGITNGSASTLTVDKVIFDSNNSKAGAVYNKGTITITGNSKFLNNSSNNGAALMNTSNASISNSTFEKNSATQSGGAIWNNGGTSEKTVSITDSKFTGNYTSGTSGGGAIYQKSGYMNISDSIFEGNGWSDYDKNTASPSTSLGGAIYQLDGTITISGKTSFIKNTAKSDGGAIYNANGTIAISSTSFEENTANSGGAIYVKSGTTSISNSTFEKNSATQNGGAIYTMSSTTNISNSTFEKNSATQNGGAIYIRYSTVNLSGTNTFTGNTANGTPNDIYNEAKLNINDGTTTINGGISGTGKTYINGGTLAFGNGATFTDGYLHLNGGTLSLINGGIDTFNITNLNLDKNSFIAIDADLASQTAPFDKINVTNFSNSSNYTINISNIKVLSDFANPNTVSKTYPISDIITSSVAATQDIIKNSVECNLTNVVGYSPIYKYNFNYDKTTGMITASRFGGENYDVYNPAILPSPVVAQMSGYATMLENFNQGFRFVDNYMNMPKLDRMAYRDRNKYALLDNTPQYTGSATKSAWVSPYTSFENVKLDNGPDVDAILYGTYFGVDSDIYTLNHGWDVVYSMYAGYNGAYQTYSGVNMNYNGGSLGATATFLKGNFFTAIDIAVGGGISTANTMYGTEYSTLLNLGAAAKTGYNFEFKNGRHIIQPSLMLGYSMINTFDYTNAAGVDITSDPLHAIIIQPQLKYIMNLKNGWQPYAAVSMVFNILDKSKFYAQDIALPEMSMKPYVQYGLGVQKKWGERCTGYVQAMVRNGGRNGVALSLGFKWQLGKGSSNSNL